MSRREILYFLFRWKNTILGWTAFIAVLVAVVASVRPLSYDTQSRVLVERTKAPTMVSSIFTVPEMIEAMNTEIGIVHSRPVMEAVVDLLGLGTEAAEPEGLGDRLSDLLADIGLVTQSPPRESWIRYIDSAVSVEAVVDSNILTIGFGDTDPAFASRVVNAVTDAYLAHRLEIYASRGASDFFRQRLDAASADLDRMRQDLATFKQERSISAIDESRAEMVRELGSLRERQTAATAVLAEVLTRFAPNHPQALAAQEAVDSLATQLDVRSRALQDLERWAASLHEMETRIASQETLVESYRTRLEQEQTEEGATQDIVNVRIVQYAPVPVEPKTQRLTLIKAGLAGGLLLAFLIALIRQYLDRRVTDPETAERILGAPVLGSIPQSRALRHVPAGRAADA